MPIEASSGTLDIENAKLRASEIIATASVGIGTTDSNQAYPLQIFKETGPDIRIQEGATSSSAARLYSNNSNLYIQTGTNFTSGSSGDIAFQTMGGQSTHMIVKSDGKVGIGVTNPTYELHMDGNMRIDNGGSITLYRSDTTGGPSLTFRNPDDSVSGWFGFGSNNRNEFRMVTNNNYPLTFYTSATGSGVERMRIAADGNLGIGTNSPGSKLHVYDGTTASLIVEGGNNTIGTDTAQIILRNKLARRAGLEFQDDSDNSRIWHIGRRYASGSASTKLSFSNVNNDEVMTITNAGNVGIGVANPTAKLHVNGNFYAPGSVVQVQSVNTSSDFSTTTGSSSGSATYPDTGIKLSITPKFSTSKILVNFNFLAYLSSQTDGGANGARINVKRKINGGSQTTVYGLSGVHNLHLYTKDPRNEHSFINISFTDTPNTTGVVEYELAALMYTSTGTLWVGNGGNQPITIILSEIAV